MSKDQRNGPGRPWPAGAALAQSDAPSAPLGSRAASSLVLSQLRRAILRGEIEPGAWLRQTDLAEHYEVSRTPVREALRALDREGLVRLVPNHGAQVTPLSLETFEEIYALRSGIEGLAARTAAITATEGAHALLRSRITELKHVARSSPLPEYLDQEWRLRLTIYELTSRTNLVHTIRTLREAAERYLRLAYRLDADLQESFGFHERLVAAVIAGDGNAAEVINREALQWTLGKAWPVLSELEVGSR